MVVKTAIAAVGLCLIVSPLPGAEDAPYFEYEFGRAHHNSVALADKAQAEIRRGDVEVARRDVETIMRTDPDFWIARYLRIEILAREHQWDAVIADCEVGLKESPTFLEFAIYRALANAAKGRCAAALSELDHVIGLHPGRATALSLALGQRAWLRVTCLDGTIHNAQLAVRDAKQACNLMHWKYAGDLDTLACAYAGEGEFDTAVQTEQRAMKAAGAAEMENTLQAHLALFQKHQSVRSNR
jgi:tetratricopeptide (TPR) repeat protein